MNGEERVLFREEQQLRQWWIGLLLGAVVIGTIAPFGPELVEHFKEDKAWRELPRDDKVGVVVVTSSIALALVVVVLMWALKLITEVREDGLYVRFFPLHLSFKRIDLGDVVACEAVTYSPLWEFGGWGIRRGRTSRAYNVSGNRGVRLTFADGKSLVIGSQEAEELAGAIETVLARRDGAIGASR